MYTISGIFIGIGIVVIVLAFLDFIQSVCLAMISNDKKKDDEM